MTPKNKAEELITSFMAILSLPGAPLGEYKDGIAKDCAYAVVDEMLKMFNGLYKPEYVLFDIYEPKKYSLEGESEFNGYTNVGILATSQRRNKQSVTFIFATYFNYLN